MTIQIICDDQQHVRGKITKVQTFERIDDVWEPQYGEPREPGRHHNLNCKLCRFNLPLRDDNLQRALDLLAAKGFTTPTLRFLAVVSADKRLR